MIAALLDRLRQGDRNALARLLSLAARGESLNEMQALLPSASGKRANQPLPSPSVRAGNQPLPSLPVLRGRGAGGEEEDAPGSRETDVEPSDAQPPHPTPLPLSTGGEGEHSARVIAFTGSGGVGKSTLIGRLLPLVRSENLKVAVLACDPQSPLSGGALLGDRFRMSSTIDDGVFIRSLAAVSGHGALADHLDVMIRLLETFGFDVIFLETVGAGQGDVAAGGLSDAVVLLLQPEAGDDVQWEKAGILECADIVVVNKADLPSAEQTAAQVRAALDLSPARAVPVLRVSTKANSGHAELWQAIQALPSRRQPTTAAQLLLRSALDWLEQRFHAAVVANDPGVRELVAAFSTDAPARESKIRALLRHLLE